jgi:hypothetical protein
MEYFADLDVSMAETHVQTARSSTTPRCRLRLPILRASSHRFEPAVGCYSRPAEWLRCSITA